MAEEYKEEKRPLNQLQYSTKDFPTYFDSLLARIKEEYGNDYNDFASSSVGVLLVNIMSYGLSQLSWYLDRYASDSFLETARSYDAVTRLASQIGYKVKPATASSVDLVLTMLATSADAVIAEGFRFSGPSNLTFSTAAETTVPAGSTSITVTVNEGTLKELTFSSTGLPNQRFPIPLREESTYIADTSVRVFVNGLEWDEKDFLDFTKTNQFEVSYTLDPPVVIFGDGSSGNIPPINSEIRIKYKEINGVDGK